MGICLLFVLFMILQGLDLMMNYFHEGEDKNDKDSMDHMKTLEELD